MDFTPPPADNTAASEIPFPFVSSLISCLSSLVQFQIQADKEKLLYELDNLQAQLEKAQVSSTRFQTEREDYQIDSQRQREKCDKLQVRKSAL